MSVLHEPIPYPISLADDDETLAHIGRRVAELTEHPGWEFVKQAIAAHQRETGALLMGLTPSSDAAVYVDAIGQQKGLAAVESIVLGLIVEGETAEAQIGQRQEERS